jgi:dolichol-phosphate mannosyltransferase
MHSIVVIPTYNEADNIAEIIQLLMAKVLDKNLEILVIDSNSPDGTADIVRGLQAANKKIHLICQPAKKGLGNAYMEGMHWVLTQPYDLLITMDADFSHDPIYVNDLLEKIKDTDIVVGSRYTAGGGLNAWPIHRRILSRFANWYARTGTGLPFEDLTSGFQAIRTPLLQKILSHPIFSEGYAFLIELKYWALFEKAKSCETPIVFTNRTRGYSKISKRIIFESWWLVMKLFFRRIWRN